MTRTLCLKVDACTHDGMRDGVPRLLAQLRRLGVRATFCLAFGPDRSGRAILNLFRPGFARKMLRSGAPRLYGPRTMLSGTLLPARPIASAFPDLVRRIDAEGHEVAIHGWDHRGWQDGVSSMDEAAARADLARACDSFSAILGRAPRGTAAPAWVVTPASLAAAESLGFAWASDLRDGPVCRVRAGAREFTTPQVPTTGPCVEELLTEGTRDTPRLADALLAALEPEHPAVLAVHAEVEGGPWSGVLDAVVPRLLDSGRAVRTLGECVAAAPAEFPVRDLTLRTLPGRSGLVATTR